MIFDPKDDIVDEDGALKYFSYSEKMKKLYPMMQEAKKTRKKQKAEFKLKGRTYEFVVDKEGTASLRKKPIKGWW